MCWQAPRRLRRSPLTGFCVASSSDDELKFVFKLAGSDETQSVWLGGVLSRGGWYMWRDLTEWSFDAWAASEPDLYVASVLVSWVVCDDDV